MVLSVSSPTEKMAYAWRRVQVTYSVLSMVCLFWHLRHCHQFQAGRVLDGLALGKCIAHSCLQCASMKEKPKFPSWIRRRQAWGGSTGLSVNLRNSPSCRCYFDIFPLTKLLHPNVTPSPAVGSSAGCCTLTYCEHCSAEMGGAYQRTGQSWWQTALELCFLSISH